MQSLSEEAEKLFDYIFARPKGVSKKALLLAFPGAAYAEALQELARNGVVTDDEEDYVVKIAV